MALIIGAAGRAVRKIDLADLKKHKATLDEGDGVSMSEVLVALRYPGLRLRYWVRDRLELG